MIRPSSMPALALCPRFDGDPEGNDDTTAGTLRHEAFAAALAGDDSKLAALSEEDRIGTDWAINYVKAHTSNDVALKIERKLTLLDDDFNEVMSGTPDAVAGNQIFDLKWRRRNYVEQMATYALAVMRDQGFEVMQIHILYALEMRAEKFRITIDEAELMVNKIVDAARNPNAIPTTNEYCGWCAHRLTCSAVLANVQTVANGYAETEPAKSWHPSQMQTGKELAEALHIWRTVLKKWGESIEFHALDAATKRGLTLPGFEIKQRSGKQWCKDIGSAFTMSRMEQAQFLKCCDLRLNTSAKNKEKLGIFDAYASIHGMPKAAAKRELLKALTEACAIEAGPTTQYLKSVSDSSDDE